MPFSNEIRAGASGNQSTTFYNGVVEQSLRFDNASNTYLNKTYGTAQTNTKKITASFWFKISKISTDRMSFLYARNGGAGEIKLNSNKIYANLFDTGYDGFFSNALVRDPSGWFHLVYQGDSTLSTASERNKVYLNGVQMDNGASSYTQLNTDTNFLKNGQVSHIGRDADNTGRDMDGYMAELHVIDGSVVAHTEFGETKDGVWIPKAYSGSYGNNGFHMTFANTGTATTSDGTTAQTNIGDDQSGNGRNFAVNNHTSSDVMPDCPENNFCTLNQLAYSGIGTLSEGGLTLATTTNNRAIHGTMSLPPSGKWYYEVHVDSYSSGGGAYFGWGTDTSLGHDEYATDKGIFFSSYNEQVLLDGSGQSGGYGSTGTNVASNGDIYSILLDVDNGRFYYAKNGTYFNSADPAAGTGGLDVSATLAAANTRVTPALSRGGSYNETYSYNFGQDSKDVSSANADGNGIGTFEYAVPSGFLALCSANLPDVTTGPTQDTQATDHYAANLWTGNAAARSLTGVGFQPDLVWIKPRTDTDNWVAFDSVRGVQKRLYFTAAAEATRSGDGLSSFDSDGFSIGDWNNINQSTINYVAWNWKMGTAFSNDASATSVGTIDSAGSVNTTAGQAIISYTGTGSAGTIAHGLDTAPELIIVKNLDDGTKNYNVYATTLGNNYLELNTTAAKFTGSSYFNNTASTDSVFSVGTAGSTNASGDDFIAWVFSKVEGYSAFGTWEGNASASGTFVYTGFRPRYLFLKNADDTDNWSMYDTARDEDNVVRQYLIPNDTQTEGGTDTVDFVSNGFKVRNSSAYINTNNETYFYWAIADSPIKYANGAATHPNK